MKRFVAFAAVLLALNAPLIAASLTRGPNAPFGVTADFNHDGLDDLIDGNWQYGMRFWQNTGGSYTLAKSFPVLNGEQLRGTIDVNGDGNPDLITYWSTSAPTSVVPGFVSERHYNLYLSHGGLNYTRAAVTFGAMPVAIDTDTDGRDDVVTFLPNIDPATHAVLNWTMALAHSNGNGTFEQRQTMTVSSTYPNHGFNRGVAVGDVNGDGHPDLITGSEADLMIFYGRADGTLTEPLHRFLPLSLGVVADEDGHTPRLHDIDGDGNADLVLFGFDFIRVLFGNGHGDFPRVSMARVTGVGEPSGDDYLRNLAFGNFTNTTRTDIAAGSHDGSVVIFSAPGGALAEVSRTHTDLIYVRLMTGSLRVPSQRSDVIIDGSAPASPGAPPTQVIPRMYFGSTPDSSIGRASLGRGRAVSMPNAPLRLDVTLKGTCAPDWSDSWQLVREGPFATDRNAARTVEAAIDGSDVYYRVTSTDGKTPAMEGVLNLMEPGVYLSFIPLQTACGSQLLQLEATVVH